MSETPIQDYLHTQGLKLPKEDVYTAYLAAASVIQSGQAEIERGILWYEQPENKLTDYFADNEKNHTVLKQIFMALDSSWTRTAAPICSATVYAALPEQKKLVRLAQQGWPLEQALPLTEEAAGLYLASRTAQSGWLNLAEDIRHWLEQGDLAGGRNLRDGSQMSLPICLDNGRILGVIHLESRQKNAFGEASQAVWVALALALAEPLRILLEIPAEGQPE